MAEFLYDVFISHAYEDKSTFANMFAATLKQKGLKVWYSGFELKLGDSIAGSINHALLEARFGIVIISPVYLGKQWAMNELKALLSQHTEGRILPVLHQISVQKAKAHLPVLADIYAVSSNKGLQVVVNKVLQAVKGKRKYVRKKAKSPAGKKRKKTDPKSNVNITDSGTITLGGNVSINTKQFTGRDHLSVDKKKK